MQQALAEINRKHPGYLKDSGWQKLTHFRLRKTEMAYWYYQWERDSFGDYYISNTNDELWQLL